MQSVHGEGVKTHPRSHTGVDGSWLVIAAPTNPVIQLDAGCLDFIDVDGDNLVLEAEDSALAIRIADGDSIARLLCDQLSPYTRGVPIVGAAAYADAKRRVTKLTLPSEETLFVGGVAVAATESLIIIGKVAFRTEEVEAYAQRGASLPLPGGGTLPASLAVLVSAISRRPAGEDRLIAQRRLSDFVAVQGGSNASSG